MKTKAIVAEARRDGSAERIQNNRESAKGRKGEKDSEVIAEARKDGSAEKRTWNDAERAFFSLPES
jgi:hypothetical protein